MQLLIGNVELKLNSRTNAQLRAHLSQRRHAPLVSRLHAQVENKSIRPCVCASTWGACMCLTAKNAPRAVTYEHTALPA